MEEVTRELTYKAIELFKERYGVKEPLDLFRFEEIIRELKTEATTTKRKGSK